MHLQILIKRILCNSSADYDLIRNNEDYLCEKKDLQRRPKTQKISNLKHLTKQNLI